jgi:hypothetical protein
MIYPSEIGLGLLIITWAEIGPWVRVGSNLQKGVNMRYTRDRTPKPINLMFGVILEFEPTTSHGSILAQVILSKPLDPGLGALVSEPLCTQIWGHLDPLFITSSSPNASF